MPDPGGIVSETKEFIHGPSPAQSGLASQVEVHHRGTRYVANVAHAMGGGFLIAAETGWGSNYGEWIVLGQASVAWSYLREKMPELTKREGDKAGWTKVFALIGVEVFG